MSGNTPRKRLDGNKVDYGALQLKEAEAGALGAILLDPDTATKNLRQLNRNMFADLRHMKIFETLRLLNAEEVVIDENVLIQSLKREGDDALDEAGGASYILQLSDYCPSASNFSYFFDQLKDYEARRAIYRDTQDALKLIIDPKKAPTEILEEFQKTVSKRLRQSINGKSAIRFVSPLEALNYEPEEGTLLVGDYHITRGSITVIGGPAGIGKSRAVTSLALSGATQNNWFGLKVHTQFKTLIIQAENNQMRLMKEFSEIPAAQMERFVRVSLPPTMGLAFDRQEFQSAIIEYCEEFDPDLVVIDPWNRAVRDDGQRDYREALQNIQQSLPGATPPALAIVAHTRKARDNEKKMGRAVLDELSGSHLLGSAPRSVFVMVPASNDPEDNRVVWQNPKNNDGNMVAKSAWHRKNGLFTPCEAFDWDEYEKPGERAKALSSSDLEAAFENGQKKLKKKEVVDILMEQTGVGKTVCYDALKPDGKFGEHLNEDDNFLAWIGSDS